MSQANGSNGTALFELEQKVRFTEAALKSNCCVGKVGRDYLVTKSRLVSHNELKGNRHRQKLELQMICVDNDCSQKEVRLSEVSGFLLELVPANKKPKKKAKAKPKN